jgi:hypothetical protein
MQSQELFNGLDFSGPILLKNISNMVYFKNKVDVLPPLDSKSRIT